MKVHGLGRTAAALAVLLVAAGAARANIIYTEGFSGAAGSQPAGWTANTTSGAVSQNDGSSEYEQRRTSSGGSERAFGSLSDTDVFHPGVWRDVTIEHNMRFSGGNQNNNGTVFRARNAGYGSGEYYHARIWGGTLQLYRVRGGSFSLLATDSTGPGIGSITNRLMRVSVANVPAAVPDGNGNNDSDHVRIAVQYFNGATDASPVARSINHVDTSSSAITRAGGVGFRTYFGGGSSSGNRAVFNSLQVATDNRYLLWYDDYFDGAALRPEEAYTTGGMSHGNSNQKSDFRGIGSGNLGVALIDWDAETSRPEWRDVEATTIMRLNTVQNDNGRLHGGLVLRESGVNAAFAGTYYHYRLIRDETGTDQAFAQLYRFNSGTPTLLAQTAVPFASVPESQDIFLKFSAFGPKLVGMASFSQDFSSPFGILQFLDSSPNRIMSPGSVGYRVYGSEGISSGAMNFDNLEITHLIPEPASIALLALGGIGLLRRRRRNGRSRNKMNAKLWTPCVILLAALLLTAGNAQAVLLAYDGFPDGGTSPGPSQYLTGVPSTTGSNNDSIIGQSPSITPGFTTSGAWNALDPLASFVYFRAEPGGLGYTSGRNQTLATTAGQANLFRTPSGTYTKRAARTSDDQTLPPSEMYFSGLLNTSTGRTGRIRITWGSKDSISLGLNNAGNAIVSTGSTVRGTSAAGFAQNTTHLLVGKIVEGGGGGNDDSVTLWVDPFDLRAEGANTPTLNNVDLGDSFYVAGNGNFTFDRAIPSGDTGANSAVLFDELRVSNVWRQVVPFQNDFRQEAQFQQQVAPTSAYLAPSVTIRSDRATTNQDDDPDGENIVGRVGSAFMRTLFEFDLTAARRAKTIDHAELILTSRGGGQGGPSITMDLHEYGFPFDETIATWNDPDGDGGDLTGDPTDGGTLGTFLTSATFPNNIGGLEVLFGDTPAFRTAVEDAIAAGDTTLRLLLKLDDESGSGNFFARFWDEETSTLGFHPELVLLYTPIPEPSTLALLTLGGIGLLRKRRRSCAK